MANPRKFSEKIALHNQKQAEETAAFEKIMREVSDATNKVSSGSRRARFRPPPEPPSDGSLRPGSQSLGTFRSGSLPNVAAAQTPKTEPEVDEPEEATLATQYAIGGNRMGSTSPSRNTGQRGRSSTSVGPMRRPSERKHDTSPYGSTVYLSITVLLHGSPEPQAISRYPAESPPPDSSWRRTNSDSALHQSCAGGVVDSQQTAPALSPHHHHMHPHQNHRRADIHLNALSANANRPRSSCEMPRIPNNNVYEVGGGGGLMCGELQVPGGSLPDLTSVHCPPPHGYHRASPASPDLYHHQSPRSGSGASPASGSPVGAGGAGPAPEPSLDLHAALADSALYDTHNHLSVPNTNNYLHHNKSMSPLEHSWITSSYQSHCSPPSQYSSTSNINIPSPTMVHSPGSPVESPQTDYNSIHQTLLQPFEQITMLDSPASNNYNAPYMNHNSPHSPQTTNSSLSYCQQTAQRLQNNASMSSMSPGNCQQASRDCRNDTRTRDPVPGGVYPPLSSPAIPDIILTDYSGELDAGLFGGEEAHLRAGLDLDELTLLEEPSSLLPDSAVEHEFRLDRL